MKDLWKSEKACISLSSPLAALMAASNADAPASAPTWSTSMPLSPTTAGVGATPAALSILTSAWSDASSLLVSLLLASEAFLASDSAMRCAWAPVPASLPLALSADGAVAGLPALPVALSPPAFPGHETCRGG